MNIQPFTVLLMILMILQSGGSFADIHQFHQIPLSGGKFVIHNSPLEKNTPTQYECKHCCHCHGQGMFHLNSSVCAVKATPHASVLTDYPPPYFPALPPSSLFHPPKA